MRKRVRLSAGAPPGCAIIAVPVAVFLTLVNALILFIGADQVRRFATGGDFDLGTVLAFIVLMLIITVVLYAVGAMTWIYLRAARTRVWLKGPYLVKRGILLRRRIDLRTAAVELHDHTDEARLLLTATDPGSGRCLQVPIQETRTPLPAPELTALAQAILAESGRHGHDQAAAVSVAGRLRDLAQSPEGTR